MRKLSILTIFALILISSLGAVSATKCDGLDLCTWTTSGNPDMGLPLSSGPYSECPSLNPSVYTNWDLNTQATATCHFSGEELDLDSVMLFLSIDNDVISCTLNGQPVADTITDSEGCAILDPMVPEAGRTGYASSELPALEGDNVLVCTVADRGYMAYFDACVVATEDVEEPPVVPEFGMIIGLATALGSVGIFFVVRRH